MAIRQSIPIDTNYVYCNFLKYNNVNNLRKFTAFLYNKHLEWTWFNVFEYIKGKTERKLASYQKGKNESTDIGL